jgi:nodulation protein E
VLLKALNEKLIERKVESRYVALLVMLCHPHSGQLTMANAGASHISMEFGITGPSYTISTACSSASHAMGQAFQMVRSGAADMALTGGSEAPFSFGILKAWEAMRVVSLDSCRPFSKDRTGMV